MACASRSKPLVGARTAPIASTCARVRPKLYLLACCSEVEVLAPAFAELAPTKVGGQAWFCVPAAALDGQRIIGIWAKNPNDHRGQWAAYCEAWEMTDALIAAGGPCPPAFAGGRPYQLSLF